MLVVRGKPQVGEVVCLTTTNSSYTGGKEPDTAKVSLEMTHHMEREPPQQSSFSGGPNVHHNLATCHVLKLLKNH